MQYNDILISFTKNTRINILLHIIALTLFVLFLGHRAIEHTLIRHKDFFLRVKASALTQCKRIGGDKIIIKSHKYTCSNTKKVKVIDIFTFKDGGLRY